MKNTDGRKDIYSKPSLRLKPPELPPRNTPTPSIIETDSGGGTTSPDYMDVDVSEKNMENLHEYMNKVVSKSAKQKQTDAEYLQDYFKLMEDEDSNDDDDFI